MQQRPSSVIATRGLALDLGGITGWAADNPDGSTVPLANIWDCSHTGDELGRAFGELENALITAVRRLKPAYIAKEAAVAMTWGKTNAAASRVLFGMSAIVELTADRLGLPYFDINLSTARRYFVGNGRAGKSDIWHKCKIMGWPHDDLNACDALAVLAYARSCFGTQILLGKTVA